MCLQSERLHETPRSDRFFVRSSRRESRHVADADRTSRLSLPLSFSSSRFLFFSLSISLSLSRVLSLTDAAGQLCISTGQPRGQLFLYFFLILRDHARLPPLSRSALSGYPSARVATPNCVKNPPHATLLASSRRDQIVGGDVVERLTEIFG